MEQLSIAIIKLTSNILPVVLSLALSTVLTAIVVKVAHKLNWVAFPRSDRWHSDPVALMGGIAIFFSAVISTLLVSGFEVPAILIGGCMMFLVGFWDDRFELKPLIKFLSQLVAASLLVSSGYLLGGLSWPFWLSYPLSFLWIIGLTNAINLLDNMDGLAAGAAFIISVLIGLFGLKFSNPSITIYSFILAGSTLGFLFFNYKPAKVFMGDCGSLFLGYTLSGLALGLHPSFENATPSSLSLILIIIMALPIFDTTLVTFARIIKGRSPSKGGKDHLSHRLVFLGLSEKQSVGSLYFIAAILGVISFFLYPGHSHLLYPILAIGILAMMFTGLYLSRIDVYNQKKMSLIEKKVESIPDYLKSRVQLASIIVDVTLILASLVLAHYIRFEGWNAEIESNVIGILLGVIVIKIFLIAAFGMYHSVWEHAGVADLLRLASASFLGSVISGAFASVYMGGYISVSVFVIDAFLFFFMLAASRFAFKGLRRLFAIPRHGGRNVLLYGAGDAGWLALSEIRQNINMNLNPVGFIDDSPYKRNGKIQGVRVLGKSNEIHDIIIKNDIELLLLCVRDLSEEKVNEMVAICNALSIDCKRFDPSFVDVRNNKSAATELIESNFSY